jgi:hypothetical protein
VTKDSKPDRDVYAGDTSFVGPANALPSAVFEYEIVGDADPNVLALVCNVAVLANTAPRSCRMQRTEGGGVIIWMELDCITLAKAHSIQRKLQQLTCVTAARFTERSG